MRSEDLPRYFLKELETFKVPNENVSGVDKFRSKDWVITCWDKSRIYVKLIGDDEKMPSEAEQAQMMAEYGCKSIAFCNDLREMARVLAPIHEEIDIKSGNRADREARWKAHEEYDAQQHQAALARKAERQRLAEIRREKQLEKAKQWHLEHDAE